MGKRIERIIGFFIVLACIIGLDWYINKTINIDLPFEIINIKNVEMYHLDKGATSAEKKVIVEKQTIKDLYDMFESLSLRRQNDKGNSDAEITSFRFNLMDGTSYDLVYGCYGVKNGYLKSSTSDFKYSTSADIGSYWDNINVKVMAVEEGEDSYLK